MSCYHPLVAFKSGYTENGKDRYIIKGKYIKDHDFEDIKENKGILIPCGQCIGCRLDYSRRWADRMMLELETAKKGIFVTLTYNNENAHWSQFDEIGFPMYATLDKRDCQLWMKRLREHYKGVRIRFYLAGEYGTQTNRPHYHAIIYGLSLFDFDDRRCIGRNNLGQQYYTSDVFQKIWNLGNVLITDVSWRTMAYVSRYITKKLTGEKAIKYAERNQDKEFSLMSRRPGIGAEYLEQHPDCLDYEEINLSTVETGVKIRIPQYYLRKMELTEPEKVANIREQRKKAADDNMLIQLQKTDLGFAEYLEVQEQKKLSDIRKKLPRK